MVTLFIYSRERYVPGFAAGAIKLKTSCAKTLTVTAMLFDHISLGRDQFTYIAKQQAYNAS